jgi:hypothetical protein
MLREKFSVRKVMRIKFLVNSEVPGISAVLLGYILIV